MAVKIHELLSIATKGYELGGLDLLAVVDAERSALSADLALINYALHVRRAENDTAFLRGAYDEKGAQ